MFSRREFNTGLIGAALPALPTSRPLNVLVIQTDQQRADMLGCAGNDRLAAERSDPALRTLSRLLLGSGRG